MKLAHTLHRLFRVPSNNIVKPSMRIRRTRPCKLTLESLERREVFSTDLLSAFALGNETGQSAQLDIAVDSAGNSYVSGYFAGTVDFDPSTTHLGDTDILTSRGVKDAYVAKYAPDDSLLWALRMGGDSEIGAESGGVSDSASSIDVDANQNVYVVGHYLGTADFGANILTTGGDRDNFAMKLNSAGAVQWVNRFGGNANDQGLSVDVDGIGNVYALGYRHDLDSSKWGVDIKKLSPGGSTLWTKSINTGTSTADLTVDNAGNVFIAGQFSNSGGRSTDFDPGSKTNYQSTGGTGQAGYVLSLSTQGAFSWVSVFKGQVNSYSAATDINLDNQGNLVVGGYYSGSVDFNPGSGTTLLSGKGAFVTKLNKNGGLAWARSLDSLDTTGVHGLTVDSADGIYVAGYFAGTTEFDPGSGTVSRTSAGGLDGYLLNLTSAGDFGWVETFGGIGQDRVTAVFVDSSNKVYLAGYFMGNVDFNPSIDSFYLNTFGTHFNGFRLRLRRS